MRHTYFEDGLALETHNTARGTGQAPCWPSVLKVVLLLPPIGDPTSTIPLRAYRGYRPTLDHLANSMGTEPEGAGAEDRRQGPAPDSRGEAITRSIRIIIADDHPIVRRGLCDLLDASPEFTVLAEATDGHDALAKSQQLCPDVLLLDLDMPGPSAVDIIRVLKGISEPPRVLVVSAYTEAECVIGVLRAGAEGYVFKTEHISIIEESIRAVCRGEIWLSEDLTSHLLEQVLTEPVGAAEPELTPREREVLALAARGDNNAQIAAALGITSGTVKNHLSNLYEKLGVNTRAELVAWAWRHGQVRQ